MSFVSSFFVSTIRGSSGRMAGQDQPPAAASHPPGKSRCHETYSYGIRCALHACLTLTTFY
jgi:hypothetical protein